MSTSIPSDTLNTQTIAAVPTEPVWRLSVEQYHQMIRLGILSDDDPVELLDGWLVYKMPKNPPHRATTKLTRNALEAVIPEGWYVDTQEPITLADSEPEPDVVVVRGNTRDYLDRHPGASDIALIIEVADSTLERDRTSKQRLYARAGIPIYWIINLPEKQVEVYTEPVVTSESIYQRRQDYQLSDEVPVAIAGQIVSRLSVLELLP
ncbi:MULTISPECIES: Uma2 family endonuclease [Cyanophyceae]|uniref:Uma2 family endonuclease n=1 Tax=Cyanophyceae TaxID=3028117 RepID=UPI0028C4AC1C|nr:Uma2 family endonuclease [Trichocoleus sp. FACHB-69]